ncbi:c2 domain containing protein [Ophiostoma piceae UAMH 11346]|uniref:C2 domain containing protein n=1 Tax=Ophiostoma piceae (strain UAMH 11346) TaxID=1262450 RepID=S3CCN2_OPHP1|nr:c2 domain containing protein [Ophiostoma piceae UAMH 11346]
MSTKPSVTAPYAHLVYRRRLDTIASVRQQSPRPQAYDIASLGKTDIAALMTSKGKVNPLNGVHTSGIFSDLSVDGPIIGTLVLVVDRAKNLPNRKTIGKQDPYCAARLGKEAKKTNTDIRGGQTPRWDQELRFKVHDSPDYYQLKVSVFSDDKKTELIGETWIDLRDIIIGGGGQSDKWHTLNYRGKYAGETRIEITYYDSRPKPEKPAPPPTALSASSTAAPSAAGSMRGRLGGDVGAHQQYQHPDHVQTPPHVQPNPLSTYTPNQSPIPPVNYSTPPQQIMYQQQPLQQQQQQLSHQQSGSPAPPARYQNYPDHDAFISGPDHVYDKPSPAAHQQQQHHRHQSHHSHSQSQYGGRDFDTEVHEHQPQLYDQQQQMQQIQQQDPRDFGALNNSPARITSSSMAPTYQDHGFAPPVDERPPPPPAHRSRNNSNSAAGNESMFRSSVDASMQATMRREVLRNEAHRQSISSAYPGRPTYRPLDLNTAPSTVAAPEVPYQPSPPRHQPYENSYEGQYNSGNFDDPNASPGALVQTSFRRSSTQPLPPPQPQQQQQVYQEQPSHGNMPQGYNKAPSPAPLNITHRSSFSASPAPTYTSTTPTYHQQGEPGGYARRSPSPIPPREYTRTTPSPQPGPPRSASFSSYDARDDPYQSNPSVPDNSRYAENPEAYMLPPVPASLIPGADPSLTLELRSRIYQDERQSEQRYTLPPQSVMETPPRGRQMSEDARSAYDYDGTSQAYTPQRSQLPQSYNTPPPQPRYERSPGPYSSEVPSPAVAVRQRGASPNPQHTIKRKSVSPAPASIQADSERRMSGIPFGPDSYDSLNPALVAAKSDSRPDYDAERGKIIAHDGKEIDPSDHLPMDTWAPEPEPKPPSATPTSGRKQLRIAGRPQSSMGSTGVTFSSSDDPGTTYTPTGRNRLQKKANRQSVAAIPVSSGFMPSGSPQTSAPLAPLTHSRQQQDNFTPPRALVRASTYDYSSENNAPSLYGSSPGRTNFGGGAPPIPAKVPVGAGGGGNGVGHSPYGGASHTGSYRNSVSSFGNSGTVSYRNGGGGDRSPVMTGALQHSGHASRALPWNDGAASAGVNGSSTELALLEEMSRIDIGSGRSRRHQGQY